MTPQTLCELMLRVKEIAPECWPRELKFIEDAKDQYDFYWRVNCSCLTENEAMMLFESACTRILIAGRDIRILMTPHGRFEIADNMTLSWRWLGTGDTLIEALAQAVIACEAKESQP